MKSFENKMNFPAQLGNEEMNKLFLDYFNTKNKKSREALINGNMRLVAWVINNHFKFLPYDKDDLMSVGTLGLIKAVDAFNPNKNIKFASFATRCIYNDILMYHRKFKKTLTDVPFDAPIYRNTKGEELIIEDILPDDSAITIDECNEKMDKDIKIEKIKRYLSHLPEKQRNIIIEKYLKHMAMPTDEEVADALNLGRTNVCRLKLKAIKQIKKDLT